MDFPTDNEDTALYQLTPGDDPDEVAAAAAKTAERLQIFGASLAKRRDDWVAARAALGLDKQWAEDLEQFNGRDSANRATSSMMQSVQQGFPVTQHKAQPTRSTVFVQVTRQKTNAAAARLSDILLPTDERNFAIQPTTLPNLPVSLRHTAPMPQATGAPGAAPTPQASLQQPMQATAGPQGTMKIPGAQSAPPPGSPGNPVEPISDAVAQMIADHAEAKTRADAMQNEIADCLEQCDHNAEVRRVLGHMALFGVGVIKGPIVVNRVRRAWTKKTDLSGKSYWKKEQVAELKPASYSVDPRYFYPDPACGEDVQKGRGAFELQKETEKQVRLLAKQPLYLKDQLRQVIEEGPQPSKRASILVDVDDKGEISDETYEHWIYWGEVDREDLEAAGVSVPEDELDVLSACVEMINTTVVRAYLNPLPEGALPYDIAPWEPRPGTVWGYGVPYLMRAQQRVINAGWRMILDNAGVSSGPQIVMKPGAITPADQQWTLTSRKIWYASDDVEDVNKAFATFEFNSHQKELEAIIALADKLSDQETAVPALAQGQGNTPETVGGMQMLMNNTNVMLRRLVKLFDDRITKPHIRRYYDYLMEYSSNDEIKGDFSIVALGTSALVVRDIQNQAITNMLALGGNPTFAPLINLKKLFEKALKAQHIDPTEVMNTDAEIAEIQQRAQQNQQPDPRVVAAQARSQADMQRTQAQVEMNRETLQTKQETAMQELQLRRELAQMAKDTEMLKLAQQSNLTLEQIRASLASTGIKERSKQQMQQRDIELGQAEPAVAVAE